MTVLKCHHIQMNFSDTHEANHARVEIEGLGYITIHEFLSPETTALVKAEAEAAVKKLLDAFAKTHAVFPTEYVGWCCGGCGAPIPGKFHKCEVCGHGGSELWPNYLAKKEK
jgi:hypothetical protein